jgi:hypothetical protein
MSFDLKILNGDLVVDSTGDLKKVENKDKLIQDLLKICTTPKGSKRKYPFYGSLITNSLIGSAFPEDFINTYASSQLKDSLQSLIDMQGLQQRFQYMSPQESIAALREVSINRFTGDPRYFLIYISVINKAFDRVDAQFELNTTGL